MKPHTCSNFAYAQHPSTKTGIPHKGHNFFLNLFFLLQPQHVEINFMH